MAAPLAAPAAPARTRTNLYGVAGDAQLWGVNHDSPLVTALPFVIWQQSGPWERSFPCPLLVAFLVLSGPI